MKQQRRPISIKPLDEAPAALPVEGERPEPSLAPEARQEPATATRTWRKAATRENRRGVAFYLPPTAFRQLGRLSVDTDRTIQDLMLEAVDDLFRKHSLPRVAREEGR
jgi:hypothetical protein